MKVWAYLNSNGVLCCALNQSSVPAGVNATELDVNSPDDVVYESGTIRPKTQAELLAAVQQQALQQLSQSTLSYISHYYPDWKQRSDISDLANGEAYLTYAGINITQIRQIITQQILSGASYTQALSTLNQTFNSNTNPTIGYWLEQLLKVGYRQDFVFKVKQQYYSISQQLSSATALPLPSYTISVPPPNVP
ncbi:TPA: conserved hypothetical protein [Aquificae Joseph's Coat Spring virus]|nr:TPA: conserved hypothetical protein [Aquificae Joseph's Coat Spring virus]